MENLSELALLIEGHAVHLVVGAAAGDAGDVIVKVGLSSSVIAFIAPVFPHLSHFFHR